MWRLRLIAQLLGDFDDRARLVVLTLQVFEIRRFELVALEEEQLGVLVGFAAPALSAGSSSAARSSALRCSHSRKFTRPVAGEEELGVEALQVVIVPGFLWPVARHAAILERIGLSARACEEAASPGSESVHLQPKAGRTRDRVRRTIHASLRASIDVSDLRQSRCFDPSCFTPGRRRNSGYAASLANTGCSITANRLPESWCRGLSKRRHRIRRRRR